MFIRSLTAASITLSMVAGTAAAQQFATNPFTDVESSHANFEAIEHLRMQNVLKGYIDGTFQPDRRISRSEFVKLIANPYILDTEGLGSCITENMAEDRQTVYFPDVPRDSWFASEVCLAKTKKLIDGYPDGTFKPNDYINFVEAAKIVVNTFVLQTNPEPENEQWYRKYVDALAERKAIPMSITAYDTTISRGDMAEMLFRLKTHNETKPSRSLSTIK